MNVSTRRYADALVLRVFGRLDQDTCEAFREKLMAQVEEALSEHCVLVIDLAGMEYVSSAGLRCFLLAARRAKAREGLIYVAALQPMVKEIFAISHFDLMFEIHPTVSDALAAVSDEA